MRTQRSLFFGSSQRPARKEGENRLVPQRRMNAIRPEEVETRFSSPGVTRFGGYPLWAAFVERLGLDQKLAQHLKMNRGALAFTAPEISRFFIDTRILGAERLYDVDEMRHDPLLTGMLGIDTLPSDETIGRYFKSFQSNHLAAFDHLNTRLNNQLWKRARRQRRGPAKAGWVVLDYDSTTTTVYGEQEGADRGRCFRKKDEPGFQPKFAFLGGLGLMVHQKLYPQSVNLGKEFEDFHAETLARLPKTARVWAIRGDGALYSEDRVRWLEARDYTYAISAARNANLRSAIEDIAPEAWEEGTDERGRPYSIARISYRPKTWSEPRTFVVSRRLRAAHGQAALTEYDRYRYFAYVTNYRAPLRTQYQFAVERCSLESFIKESKAGFCYDAIPCRELNANLAFLAHVQLAYNLLLWWKLLLAPPGVSRWTIATIRARLFNVAGHLRRHAGAWLLALPIAWPWRTLHAQMARTACGFRT
jgi:hypothetical protein